MGDTRAASIGKTVLVSLAAVFLVACEEEVVERAEVIRPVKAIQVESQSTFRERWFSGQAKGTQEIDLSFRVAGTLVERPVDVGSDVKQGDIIARLDPATFKADVDRAQADLARAEATLINADDQLRRQQVLVSKGHLAEAALDRQLAAEREAKADVVARKAALRRTELDFGYTMLEAPFSGVVVRTFVENFQDIQAKQPVIRLVDNSRIEMIVDIPESLISQAHSVEEVLVRFDALPGIDVTAEIKEIGAEASQATRTYPITLIMDQPDGATILPGMAGKASASKVSGEDWQRTRIIVPETAVLTKGNESKTFVWVFDESTGSVSEREIQTAALADRGIEVTSGLQPGEYVVTAGVHYLEEGQKVRLLK